MTLKLKDINFNIAMYGTEPVVQSTYSVVYTGDESSVKVNFNVTDETDLTGATAKVHLYFADSSHIEKDAQIDGTVVHYTLKGTENDHAGPVRVDVFITLNGATYTRAGYKFRIDQSLEASAPLVEYAIETLDTVIEGADEWLAQAQTDFGTAQNQRAAEWVSDNDTRDDQFNAAQASRTESFGQSETARTDAFNTSETGRSNTFTTNENARQAAADANETARNNSYTVAENDREERYGIAESNRSATADADHTRAVGDHNTATDDHGIAESDHVTATADHENYAGLLEDGILTTQIVDKLTELETTYAPDLFTVKQQLEHKVNQTDIAGLSSSTPLIVGAVGEMTDTSKNYVLSTTGEIYSWLNGVITASGVQYQSSTYSVSRTSADFDALGAYKVEGFSYRSDVSYTKRRAKGVASITAYVKGLSTAYIVIGFLDSTDALMTGSVYAAGTAHQQYTADVPTDAEFYVIVTTTTSVPAAYYSEIYNNINVIKQLDVDRKSLTEEYFGISDFAIGRYTAAGLDLSVTTFGYLLKSTENVDHIEVKTQIGSTAYPSILFFDADMNVLTANTVATPTTATYLHRVGMPAGAAYYAVSCVLAYTSGYVKVYHDYPNLQYVTLRDLKNNIGDLPEIILPSVIPVVAAKEMALHYENVLSNTFAREYEVNALPTIVGSFYQPDCRQFIPTEGLADRTVTVTVSKNKVPIVAKTSTLKTIPTTAGTGLTKNVLFIGDSKTWSGVKLAELVNLFDSDAMSINLVGTLSATNNDANGTPRTTNHEARYGWGIDDYYNKASFGDYDNAFYNPVSGFFDFAYYLANSGIAVPDYVFIDLGANDTSLDKATLITYYQHVIDSIRAYSATMPIVLSLQEDHCLALNDKKDTYGEIVGKGTLNKIVKPLIETYDNQQASKIYLCPQYLNVDLYNDFPMAAVPINNRSTTTVLKATDVTHLALSGYYKVADCDYYMIKYLASLGV